MPASRAGALAVGIPAAVVVALFGWFLWMLLFYDGRQEIDLSSWVGPQTEFDREMMPNPRWSTDQLCDDTLPCSQAVTSDTLTMYRFEDRDDAVAAAESFGENGYLTGWIAVRYEPGGLDAEERADFEYGIGCINTWVNEDGRDC